MLTKNQLVKLTFFFVQNYFSRESSKFPLGIFTAQTFIAQRQQ